MSSLIYQGSGWQKNGCGKKIEGVEHVMYVCVVCVRMGVCILLLLLFNLKIIIIVVL
jgi:hypothetical protein